MDHDHYSDEYLRRILTRVTTIAVVGASDNPRRPSFGVMRFLAVAGYRVFAINPKVTEKDIDGLPVFPSVAAVPEPIDMIDVFRNNAAVPGVVDECLALRPLPSVIWMQLGVRDDVEAERAEARGIQVVMNRCPKIDRPRLLGR